MRRELVTGVDATSPAYPGGVEAQLIRFGGVYSLQTDFS